MLAHNHPGGEAKPSYEDSKETERIRDFLHMIDIELLDHVIIGEDGAFSMLENGCLM